MITKLKVVLFWGGLIALVLAAIHGLEQWWTLQELQQLATARPMAISALYATLLILIGAFCLPGSGPLTVFAGAIFGLWWGILLVSFASAIGATLAMMMTRTWMQGWVKRKFSGVANKILTNLEQEGVWYLFSVRLLPAIPFFVVNLVFGLTRIPAWRFYVVTQLGMLAGVAIYVNAGTHLKSLSASNISGILNMQMVLSLLLLALFPWLVKLVMKKFWPQKVYAEKAL